MESTIQKGKKFRKELVNKLSWAWIIVNAIVMGAGVALYPEVFERWIISVTIVTSIALSALVLNRFDQTRIAAYLLPIGMFLHITRLAYTGGGTVLPGIMNFIPIILTTGFLLGRKKGIIMAVLCFAVTFGIALLETNGTLPEVAFSRLPMGRALAIILPISIATVIQYLATRQLSANLVSLEDEILKRKEAEKIKDQTLYNLGERVKELTTLYTFGRILQREGTPIETLLKEMVITIPPGWQFPSITEARLSIGEIEYTTPNYKPTEYMMMSEMHTSKGTNVRLEVVYLQSKPEKDEGPFLKEERHLINMLVEMLKIDLERREAEEKISQSVQLLKKITSQVPANTYMFEIKEDGRTNLLFSNRGTDPFIHKSNTHSNPEKALELSDKLYEEDKIKFNQVMKKAFHDQSNITIQYRVIEDGNVKWRWMKATPEKGENGTITWYGATSDITPLIEYIASIEQVLYDISHVIRRPISTMLGMTKLISDVNFSEAEVKEISKKLHGISKEMDSFISELNHDYQKKKEETKFGIDFNSPINKRNSLFNY
jgi:hypothetical protein